MEYWDDDLPKNSTDSLEKALLYGIGGVLLVVIVLVLPPTRNALLSIASVATADRDCGPRT